MIELFFGAGSGTGGAGTEDDSGTDDDTDIGDDSGVKEVTQLVDERLAFDGIRSTVDGRTTDPSEDISVDERLMLAPKDVGMSEVRKVVGADVAKIVVEGFGGCAKIEVEVEIKLDIAPKLVIELDVIIEFVNVDIKNCERAAESSWVFDGNCVDSIGELTAEVVDSVDWRTGQAPLCLRCNILSFQISSV